MVMAMAAASDPTPKPTVSPHSIPFPRYQVQASMAPIAAHGNIWTKNQGDHTLECIYLHWN